MKPIDSFISHRLESIRELFGYIEIYYCYDLVSPDSWTRSSREKRRFYECTRKNRLVNFSTGSLTLSWQDLTRKACRGNKAPLFEMYRNQSYIWPDIKLDLRRELQQLHSSRVVTVSIPCRISENYVGRFTVIVPTGRSGDELFDDRGELYKMLFELQVDVSLNLSRRLNPLVGYNIVNPVSVYLLELLTSGCDRKEASSKMRITMRGVDYHLAALKSSLGARNLPHLVKLASTLRLL